MGAYLMQKVTFTNSRGQSIVLCWNPYILSDITGIGDLEADLQTQQAPFQDGSTLIDTLLKERSIALDVTIRGTGREHIQNLRRYFSQVFNPKLGLGTLRYEIESGIWEIAAAPEGVPSYPYGKDNRSSNLQKATVDLLAPNPYWKSIEITSEPMSAYIGLFEWSLEFPIEYGMQGASQTFVNNGDVDVPVIIEFHGPATNPVVTNETTGAFVKINRDLQEGDVLILNTDPDNLYVTINGDDVFNWVDASSILSNFVLIPGENLISYSADAGQVQGIAKLTWRERSVGI
jgi:hypothetical protein